MFSYIFHKKFKTDAEYLHQEMPHFYDQKGQPCRLHHSWLHTGFWNHIPESSAASSQAEIGAMMVAMEPSSKGLHKPASFSRSR